MKIDKIQQMPPGYELDGLVAQTMGRQGVLVPNYSQCNQAAVQLLDWLKSQGIGYSIISTYDQGVLVELTWIRQTPPIKWAECASKGGDFCIALCRAIVISGIKNGLDYTRRQKD